MKRATYYPESGSVWTTEQRRQVGYNAFSWFEAIEFCQREADSRETPVTLTHAHASMSGVVLYPTP